MRAPPATSSVMINSETSIRFKNWGVVGLGLKTGVVVGPKCSTDEGM